ncbi:MAG: hypothetical protein AB7C89_02440 [Intestinibacillus sp.]
MKRKISFFSIGLVWGTPAFLFLIALFLCGVIAGGFTGLMGGTQGSVARLTDYLTANASGETSLAVQAVGAVGSTLIWIVLCLVAGAMTPYSLFLAAVVAARGFVLSFTVAAVVGTLGLRGVGISLVTTGAPALVTVPCLLIVATTAFLAAADAPQGKRGGYLYALGRYRGALTLCIVLSAVAALLRAAVTPLLLTLMK